MLMSPSSEQYMGGWLINPPTLGNATHIITMYYSSCYCIYHGMFVLQSCCGEGGGSEKWYILGEERRTAFSKSKVPLWQKFNFSATEIYRHTYNVYDESLYLTTQPFMMRKATY